MLLKSLLLSVAAITSLLLSPQDAEPILLGLDEVPTITYTDSELTVTTKSQVLSFPVSTRVECTFSDNDGVEDVFTENTVTVNLNGKMVEMSGLNANSSVYIYDIGGSCVLHQQSDTNGALTLDLSNFATGVYILKSNQVTYKFVLK